MKIMILAAALAFLAPPALADSCDDLIRSLEGAISLPGSSAADMDQLKSLLEASRAAKAKGDLQSCEAAMTGGMRSPMPQGRRGHDCEKTEDKTV